MKILPILHGTFSLKQNMLLLIISTLAILGTFTVLLGGVWDTISHALKIPENFWTMQHISIYTGATVVGASAALGTLMSLRNKKFSVEIIIILLGAIMQLGGGFVDYNFHEIYGIDGLVTPSHITVESGLFLSALGGFIIISKLKGKFTRKIIPISIVTVLLAGAWVCFNLSLLIGAIVLCVPIYELFSSGCAVM